MSTEVVLQLITIDQFICGELFVDLRVVDFTRSSVGAAPVPPLILAFWANSFI